MSSSSDRSSDDADPRRRKGRPVATLVALVALCLALLVPAVGVPAAAAPPTSDGPTAAGYAAGWLAARVTPGGFAPDPLGDPSPGDTLLTALALATAGVDQATFDRT